MHIDEQIYLTLQTENIHFKIEISIQHYMINLSVTCGRSVVFCGYSGFLHQ